MIGKIFKSLKYITPQKWHWVLDNDGYRRYFENTSWMFAGQIFSLIISFFIGAWVARYLGPENYGILNYSIAFVGLFGFIASLGVDGILNRELIKTPNRRDELMGTTFHLKLIGGGIALFLTIVSVLILQTNPLIKILVILFSFTFILQSFNIISNYFNSEVKAKNSVKATFVATIISSILKIIIILSGKGVIWIVIVFVLDSLWMGIGLIRAYNNNGLKIINWQFNKILANDILRNSWPLMLASAAGFIYIKIDQVLIGQMLGNYDVGIYAAAVKLVEVWYFIPMIICSSLFPAIVNAKKTGIDIYKRRLKSFYILMAVIPILMAIPITISAKPIIQIMFGSGYLESVNILRIYIWSSFGFFISMAMAQYLILENLVRTIFWLNFSTMIINIILNIILIPKFGIVGSAMATSISYLITPLVIFIINRYNIKL